MKTETQTTKVRRFALFSVARPGGRWEKKLGESPDGEYVLFSDYGELLERFLDNEVGDQKNHNERDTLKAKLATLEAERDAGKRDIEFLQREVKKREYDRGALVERCEALSAEVQKLREACKNGLALLTALVADDEHQSLDRDMIFDQMTAALNSNAGEKETR